MSKEHEKTLGLSVQGWEHLLNCHILTSNTMSRLDLNQNHPRCGPSIEEARSSAGWIEARKGNRNFEGFPPQF